MIILLFFIGLWYFSLFCQTFFMHRYAAHGAFTMRKGWEKFFYVLSWMMQGSSYLSPRTYAILHRLHHAHTDTEDDPHSPSYSKHVLDMMLITWRNYSDIHTGVTVVEEKYLKNLPDWPAFDKFAHGRFSRLFWVAVYITIFIAFATSPWWYLLLPLVVIMAPLHGVIINWYAHRYGYESFDMPNTSKNLLPVDFLMLGESYHNNHHKYPSNINFGHKRHEIDPVYPIILLFNKLRIIRLPARGSSL